jgi:hypothetical protein
MTAVRTPTPDESRVAAAYVDVLARVELVADAMRAGDWQGVCHQARRLSILADRLVERLTAPVLVDGQLVRTAAGFVADAGVLLALVGDLADPASAAVRVLHAGRTGVAR